MATKVIKLHPADDLLISLTHIKVEVICYEEKEYCRLDDVLVKHKFGRSEH